MLDNKSFKILLVYPSIPGMLVLPSAIGLFTAILKKAGFELDLFDATLYRAEVSVSPEKRVDYLQARKFSYKNDLGIDLKPDLIGSFRQKVDSFKPDLLIFSVVEDAFKQAISLLDAIKEKNIPHIFGGVFTTAAPEKVIACPQVKMIGIGEGEETVLELAQKLRSGGDISDIPNTWFKKDTGQIIKNSIRPLVDINKVLPDYGLFEEKRFFRPMGGKILKTVPLETARGCPYQCTFCDSPMWTRLYHEKCGTVFLRRKSINSLIEEIRYLVREYNPDLLYVIDDTFLARPIEEIRDFAEKYREFQIPFWMNTRPETLDQEKIDLLKQMNCYRMSIGVECGNEEFRKKKLRRFGSNNDILKSLEILSKSGIPFSINNIIGFPDETRELIFETIVLNRQFSGYDSLTVSIFTPYHGSKLREEAVQKGYLDPEIITTHTTSSSSLNMPQLSARAIDGLMRTFTMYVGFPKDWWPYIKKAESFTPEGDAMFAKLSEIYRKVFLSRDQLDRPKTVTNWEALKKQILFALNEISFFEKIIPNLKEKKILDLGCGRGEFLTAMKSKGYDIIGVEPDPYKDEAIERNKKDNGVEVEVLKVPGEAMPFQSETFDFIYCNDVLEHCKNPHQLLREIYRVLKPEGQMYLTVINRFGLRDPHFHLNFLNWIPRWLGERYIILRGKSKIPIPGRIKESRYKLSDMHYFTFSGFKKIAQEFGFEVKDLKEYKIRHPELMVFSQKKMVSLLRVAPLIYRLSRLFYLPGFRLLLKKK
mgnify:CR=1 FL=1